MLGLMHNQSPQVVTALWVDSTSRVQRTEPCSRRQLSSISITRKQCCMTAASLSERSSCLPPAATRQSVEDRAESAAADCVDSCLTLLVVVGHRLCLAERPLLAPCRRNESGGCNTSQSSQDMAGSAAAECVDSRLILLLVLLVIDSA